MKKMIDDLINGNVLIAMAPTLLKQRDALRAALEATRDLLNLSAVRYMICDGGRGHLGEQSLYHRTMNSARSALALCAAGKEHTQGQAAEMQPIPLYHHKTDGGAEYLTDKFIICPDGSKEGVFAGANLMVRLDGDPELTIRDATIHAKLSPPVSGGHEAGQ